MDITPLVPKDLQTITHYGDGGFVVNGTTHKGNILITTAGVFPWAADSMSRVLPDSFAPILTDPLPEILLIGAGARFAPLPVALKDYFREKTIAVDAMDTGAACRTYSVLLTEGRLVAAALIAI